MSGPSNTVRGNNARGTVYWITGLAGAGKTTLAHGLLRRLRQASKAGTADPILLDGDELRARLFPDTGYDPDERLTLALHYARLCDLFASQGRDVVCATVSLFPQVWEHNRRVLTPYREVLVRAPRSVLAARRQALYAATTTTHVVGRDSAAPEPPAPHVVLENDGTRSPEALVEELLLALETGPAESSSPPAARSRLWGTKAETLAALAPLLASAKVLPQVRLDVAAWRDDPERELGRLRATEWSRGPLLVRSSARDEDRPNDSQAGRYPSVAVGATETGGSTGPTNITGTTETPASDWNDPDHLDACRAALERVATALGSDDQIFVQPLLENVRLAGVALTRDPDHGGHVTTIVYDESGRTDGVTSGRAEEHETFRRHNRATEAVPAALAPVFLLLDELGEILDVDETSPEGLDVEFAVDGTGRLVLFQVRPLSIASAAHQATSVDAEAEAGALDRVARRVAALSAPHPYLFGTRAVFGTMPDWNPAEIIGVRPHPLAFSLYRELVTDGIWAYQRHNYGYRNLRSFPLLVSFEGQPYVDVRVSFNSFLPADLPPELGRKLVDGYIERLVAAPRLHDKVEFSIVASCYTLDLDRRLDELVPLGLDAREREVLRTSLLALTNRISAAPDGPFEVDLAKIAELERRQRSLPEAGANLDAVARVYWLLEDAKRYGTLPFAGIARAAFVATQLLDSLVTCGVLSAAERQGFLRSLDTIRARMARDLARQPRDAFLRRYGHLRPGAYDVTAARYDQAPERYFSAAAPDAEDPSEFSLTANQAHLLDALLAEHGLQHDHRSLLRFLRRAIEGREYAKFVFTRSLSDALEELVELAAGFGYSREDVAFLEIQDVLRGMADTADLGHLMSDSMARGRERYATTCRLALPPLITTSRDVHAHPLAASEPSYVTLEDATGPVVRSLRGAPVTNLASLPEGEAPVERGLRGAIVMLPNADPGHDWIFSHAVAGFITMYGGYNSHMAVRASELGIPAVIGAGETLYRSWAAANLLRVDCRNRRVEVLL